MRISDWSSDVCSSDLNIQIPVKVIPDIISHDTDLTYAGRGRRPMGMPVYIQMASKLYDRADHGRTNEHIACKTRCHCFGGQRGKEPSQSSIADLSASPDLRTTALVLAYFVQESIGEGGTSSVSILKPRVDRKMVERGNSV